MKTKTSIFLYACLAMLTLPEVLRAQTPAKEALVKVNGEVKITLTLTTADLDKFEKSTVQAPDRNNKMHDYSGVLLADLLKKAGVTLGEELKGKNLTKYLLLEARDGYQVLFSLAEVDPAFSDKKIILANQVDGALLSSEQGPFQIIAEGEKRKARFIRQVTRITVKYAP